MKPILLRDHGSRCVESGGENAICIGAGERQHQQMSIIAQGLSDEDIADLAAWFSSLEVTVEMPD